MAPAVFARRAMKQGHAALARKNFAAARPHLERAARYEPLREEAICLMAEASLYAGKAADALYALNTLLLEQDQFGKPRSPRVRLLRGIAGCILGRSAAARRELAAIPKSQASVDELLAAAQACILSGDYSGAMLQLDALDSHQLGMGPVAARVQLCRAAVHYRRGDWQKAMDALPHDRDCSPPDAAICRQIGREVEQRFNPGPIQSVSVAL
jgi:outer membrane protein assembly factor BamD (BamD/ComL family)